MEKISGLVAAPFTPFTDRGEVDLPKIEQLAKLYQKNGVVGAFICGTTGEGTSLSVEEKKAIMQKWGQVKGSLKILPMLGGNCLKNQQVLAEHCEEYGMDGIAILPPFFFKPDNLRQLVDYCKLVASTVPNLPFYYYHIPGMTGVHFSMRTFLELAEDQIPNLAGIKYSHANLPDFHSAFNYQNQKFDLLWGTDEALLSALSIGLRGAVGSTYNYAAPLYHKIFAAFRSGNREEAQFYQYKSVQMVEFLFKYGGIATGKAFMKIIGADCGPCRPPLVSVTDQSCLLLEKDLKAIGFFDFCSKV